MEIIIDDIPDEGLEVSASEGDAWFLGTIKEVLGEEFAPGDHAKLEISISRVNLNVSLGGFVEYTSHPHCDRCLELYEASSSVPIHAIFAPLYESRRQEEKEEGQEVELIREDLEFGFYEGDRFDLTEIIREQALLAKPMKHLCSESCKGLCQRCGKDLNAGPCGCKEDGDDPRWAKLKAIKLQKG